MNTAFSFPEYQTFTLTEFSLRFLRQIHPQRKQERIIKL